MDWLIDEVLLFIWDILQSWRSDPPHKPRPPPNEWGDGI